MVRLLVPTLHERAHRSISARSGAPVAVGLVRDVRGSALLEFAIVLPLLVVFVVGIYDFSGAFNQKLKIEQAAQEAAIVAGAQPMSDIATTTGDPESLHPVVIAVFGSLSGSGILPNAGLSCIPAPPAVPTPTSGANLTWIYTISKCSPAYPGDDLVITINRGWVCGSPGPQPCTPSPPFSVGTTVTVQYPYRWRLFGSVIQLLFPGPNGYSTPAQVRNSATVHNQM